MQLHYEAKVFFTVSFNSSSRQTAPKITGIYGCASLLVSSKSFTCLDFKALSCPCVSYFHRCRTPQNVLQIMIGLSKLNKAFHDKTAGRQPAPEKGLITNLYSLLLGRTNVLQDGKKCEEQPLSIVQKSTIFTSA